MAKRLFKSSVPEEKTNGAKRSKNGILVKFCAFLLAFAASSSAAVIAFQMALTAPVAVTLKAQVLKDGTTTTAPANNVLMNPTEDYDIGKNFLTDASQADGSKGSVDNLSVSMTHHTTGDTQASTPQPIAWTNRWSSEMGTSSQMEIFSSNNKAPYSLDLSFQLEHQMGNDWYYMKQGHITIQDIYDETWSKPKIDWDMGNTVLDASELQQNHYRYFLECYQSMVMPEK